MEDEKESRLNLEDGTYYSTQKIIEILEANLKRIKQLKEVSPDWVWAFSLMGLNVRDAKNQSNDFYRALRLVFITIAQSNIMLKLTDPYPIKGTK